MTQLEKPDSASPETVTREAEYAKSILRAYKILTILFNGYRGPTSIGLWDGSEVNSGAHTRCSLSFRHPAALRELLLKRDLLKLAEAYLGGDIEVEGDIESLFDIVPWLQDLQLPLRQKLRMLTGALRLSADNERRDLRQEQAGRPARRNCRQSISHHYDVSNDFYKLWLDPQMIYSCAYFRDARQTLADAQCDKLDHICRKLRLQPGQHLLDIGCGWGALVCWAAKHYGVIAHGITLSEQQYHYAQQCIIDQGLDKRVSVDLCDYRDLPEGQQYDRIASVGMFEHIGVENFSQYFARVKSLLKPGGLFLNHGITSDTGWEKTDLTRFINNYVFPDGELARISDVCQAMEQAGFELLDMESLRRHYALTLRHWVQTLERNREAAIAASSDVTYRLWRLYMAGSAYYFDEGSINVYQVLAGDGGQQLNIPLRRDDIYLR